MNYTENNAKQIAKSIANQLWEKWDKIEYKQNAGYNKGLMGDFFEDIIMSYIDKYLKNKNKQLKTAKGLIRKKDKFSPQVDIIIYSGDEICKCNIMPIAFVESKNVRAIIECKTYIHKSNLDQTRSQTEKIKKDYCPHAKSIMIAWEYGISRHDKRSLGEIFNFCDEYIILAKKTPYKKEYNYDIGNRIFRFQKLLEKL